MVAEVGLKDFIIEVKKELLEASKAGESNPTLELQKLELEASVCLGAKAEGSWGVFIKIGGGVSAEKDQKIHLTFSPIKRVVKRISATNSNPPSDGLHYRRNAPSSEDDLEVAGGLLGPGVLYEEDIEEKIIQHITDGDPETTVEVEIMASDAGIIAAT